MDIFELIAQEHRKVEKLFSQIESTKDAKKRSRLFEQIYQELNLHARVEELTFYPSMRDHEDIEDLVDEAEEEHNEVKILLEELKALSPTSHEFTEKISELQEAVEHHVEEEEEEIFPQLRDVMSDEELEELAQEFQETKSKLQKDMAGATK
jgi:hemerythrin superfamily protein